MWKPKRMESGWWLALLAGFGAGGCDNASHSAARGTAGQPTDWAPPHLEVSVSALKAGFAGSTISKEVDAAAFQITKHPVTRKEFAACVDAKACAAVEDACASEGRQTPLTGANLSHEELPDALPVTCVGLAEAEHYCAWVGGKLPTLEQWLAGARGATVRHFSWGDTIPSCEEHPGGVDKSTKPLRPCDVGVESLRVGTHPAGASPSGMEDALLTRAELLRPDAESLLPACRPAGPDRKDTCLVHGLAPGAIDGVLRLQTAGDKLEPSPIPYGFRCVWEARQG